MRERDAVIACDVVVGVVGSVPDRQGARSPSRSFRPSLAGVVFGWLLVFDAVDKGPPSLRLVLIPNGP